jgi:type VI secretion system protein VasD
MSSSREQRDRSRVAGARLAFAAVALFAAGCGKPPVIEPPPPPVTVAIKLAATPDVNPDPSGRPSPTTVRVHVLADATEFGKADFFTLWQHDAATLGAAALGRHEVPLQPGANGDVTFKLDPATRAIGVVVAYRDFRNATWRVSVPVPAQPAPGSTITLAVTVAARAVTAQWQ